MWCGVWWWMGIIFVVLVVGVIVFDVVMLGLSDSTYFLVVIVRWLLLCL